MERIARPLFWIIVLIILLSPAVYWTTGIGQVAAELSAEVNYQPGQPLLNSPKAEALHSLSLPMRLQRLAIYPLLLLAFQLSGGAVWLRRRVEAGSRSVSPRLPAPGWGRKLGRLKRLTGWMPHRWRERLTGADLLTILLFFLIFQLSIFLLYLPFNFYRSFIVGHQFGFSAHTAASWLGDWSKSVGLALVIEGATWVGFYALIRLFPRRWPLPAGALLFAFTLIFAVLGPILITPLFYEVRPLTDEGLRQRILTLADRATVPVDEVLVIDASSKTTTVNAYVAGFGRARQMVLYDNLIDGYTPDEVEIVLAHELGHWYYRHVFWSVLGLGAAGWLGLFGLQWLLRRSWQRLGLRGPADMAGLPYILAVLSIVTTLSLPAQHAVSRYAENQADQFALDVSQKPEAFIAMFTQLAEQNLSMVTPPTWEKFIFYTHPPIAERVQRAEKFQLVDISPTVYDE